MTGSVSYALLDPTGNMTLLAETSVPEAAQPLTAKRLMALEPATEQVGFVTETEEGIGLRMAGGEFCGNASMSAAVLYLLRKGMDGGDARSRGGPAPDGKAADGAGTGRGAGGLCL